MALMLAGPGALDGDKLRCRLDVGASARGWSRHASIRVVFIGIENERRNEVRTNCAASAMRRESMKAAPAPPRSCGRFGSWCIAVKIIAVGLVAGTETAVTNPRTLSSRSGPAGGGYNAHLRVPHMTAGQCSRMVTAVSVPPTRPTAISFYGEYTQLQIYRSSTAAPCRLH